MESVLNWAELSTIGIPYRAPVNERRFLSLPRFRGGANAVAYVEGTSERGRRRIPYWDNYCARCIDTVGSRTILEIADNYKRASFKFAVDCDEARAYSLRKQDTHISALRVFRARVEEEFAEYERRERALERMRVCSVEPRPRRRHDCPPFLFSRPRRWLKTGSR